MYKNLNPSSLGVSGRQSELIELTLTYGFRGLDLDAADFIKRATLQGVEEAGKYIRSARIKIGGWTLPVKLGDDDAVFQLELERLAALTDTAKKLGFLYCTTDIQPANDKLPYHENFERHREQLSKVGDVLAASSLRLGLGLKATAESRRDRAYPFIHKAEELLTLIRTTGHSHVGLTLDTWNWKVGGGTMQHLADLKGNQIVTVTIADVPADADLETIEASQRFLPTEETIPAYAKFAASLAERKFEGPVTLLPASRHVSGMTRDNNIDKCALLLEQIWSQAGLTKPGRPGLAAAEFAPV
jgi:sugar phosphate isomerase/epimerase